jgi:hypothetical protein
MGDSQNDPLRVDFDRQIKVEFQGSAGPSDAGLLAYRELDDALEGEASGAPGSGRAGATHGGVFEGRIVATVPSGG